MATGTDVEDLARRVALIEVRLGMATDVTYESLTADEVQSITGMTPTALAEQKKAKK